MIETQQFIKDITMRFTEYGIFFQFIINEIYIIIHTHICAVFDYITLLQIKI